MVSRMARTVALVLPVLFTLLSGSAGAQDSSLDAMLDSLAGGARYPASGHFAGWPTRGMG